MIIYAWQTLIHHLKKRKERKEEFSYTTFSPTQTKGNMAASRTLRSIGGMVLSQSFSSELSDNHYCPIAILLNNVRP